jgi:hypothetical protein
MPRPESRRAVECSPANTKLSDEPLSSWSFPKDLRLTGAAQWRALRARGDGNVAYQDFVLRSLRSAGQVLA